ncbi:MAG: YihY/virulence factor BrkB family protein [Bacteroidales bacterium]|nr:YihY/virulence factor BrkB family protein [Bacteroidales bacterium]
MLKAEIEESLKGHQEVINYVMDFANNMLENLKGGLIAGAGLLILFWTVMQVLSNIERSFNDIWQIKKARSFARKFSDYISLMIIAPILIFMSSSLTVFITSQVQRLSGEISVIEYIGPIVFYLVQFVPYLIIWVLFSLLYAIMPNTKVKVKYAILAGVLAGTAFQVFQWGYINCRLGYRNTMPYTEVLQPCLCFCFGCSLAGLLCFLGPKYLLLTRTWRIMSLNATCKT